METTTESRPRRGPRNRGSGRGGADARDQYDLLTAVALGVAVGAGVALLLRRGPKGKRPAASIARAAGRGARHAGRYGARGARWAAERGGEMVERIPFDEITDQVGDYLTSARDTINEAVAEELRDLRKAIRRQRKRMGV